MLTMRLNVKTAESSTEAFKLFLKEFCLCIDTGIFNNYVQSCFIFKVYFFIIVLFSIIFCFKTLNFNE